jgi:predicted nucleotidyltransferase
MDKAALLECIPEVARRHVDQIHLYGSRYVGGEAITDASDWDLLVLPEHGFVMHLIQKLKDGGYEGDVDKVYNDSGFLSMRKGDINLIVVHDYEWFIRALTAMELCRSLKLTDKQDRILLHDVVVRFRQFRPKSGWEDRPTPPDFFS